MTCFMPYNMARVSNSRFIQAVFVSCENFNLCKALVTPLVVPFLF